MTDGATRAERGRRDAAHLALLKWGLVPRWAKDATLGHRLANARAETVATAPAFRDAWARGRRCAVLADAFYEWQDLPTPRRPRNGDPGTTGRGRWRAERSAEAAVGARARTAAPFAFAGLWGGWRDRRTPTPSARDLHARHDAAQRARRRHPRPHAGVLTGDALRVARPGTTPDAAQALLAPTPPRRWRRGACRRASTRRRTTIRRARAAA
jgi:putative SOS response-associated peptidase YedK